ncbi:MAG: DNA polymerase III subunit delta [Lachnospiraceae bacterium]|nr:DNA polymerase III subunit delta [Lachnospiraceae bacterium]
MQSILQDIKENSYKQVYLLYGEEAYLRRQYRDKLKQVLVAADDTMNYHYYEGKDTNPNEVIDLAETMPFFAERRVIIIENSGFVKHGGEALAEYLTQPSPTTVFIFVEAEVDKRSKLFKAIRDKGRVVEFAAQDENTLKRWILGLLKKENKQITENALNYFLNKTGTDMENIRRELEKVICYTMEKEAITEQDIEDICTHRVQNHIFDMVSAIADKKQRLALQLYYDLLTLKEPPMRILFLIARQFNMLLQVKELKKKGYDNRVIADKTGLHSFVVGKYAAQASKFKTRDLKEALIACVEADESVKTVQMNDRMSVELLIIKYSV